MCIDDILAVDVTVKRKSGKVWVKQGETKTMNLEFVSGTSVLNLAARKWGDEQGLTRLEKISTDDSGVVNNPNRDAAPTGSGT